MRIFVYKVLIFLIGVAVIDFIAGITLDSIRANAKGGVTYMDQYISDTMKCDILLLGSSRCLHHYNPIVIEDSLNAMCFNAGQSGNGIIAAYAIYKMTCERHKPRLVILDIVPDFDLLTRFDNHRYLSWLKAFYERDCVRDIFETIDETEKYKMKSNLYRYNSRFLQILRDYINPKTVDYVKGFVPYDREMDKTKIDKKEMVIKRGQYSFDSLKISYINKLIDDVGKDSIIIAISPRWYGLDTESYAPVLDICKERNVKFVDFSNNANYVHNDYFFIDGAHLNSRGADNFTKDLIKYIK